MTSCKRESMVLSMVMEPFWQAKTLQTQLSEQPSLETRLSELQSLEPQTCLQPMWHLLNTILLSFLRAPSHQVLPRHPGHATQARGCWIISVGRRGQLNILSAGPSWKRHTNLIQAVWALGSLLLKLQCKAQLCNWYSCSPLNPLQALHLINCHLAVLWCAGRLLDDLDP